MNDFFVTYNEILFDLNVKKDKQKGDNKRGPALKIGASSNEKNVSTPL
jgi:hypothetical protein